MSVDSNRVAFSISALLSADGGIVPRERFQDPPIQTNKNGSYFIRPWVDFLTSAGVKRKKKTIVLGAASMKQREVLARKKAVMETINRASYVIQSQIGFGYLLDEYERRHVRKLAASTQGKYDSHLKNHIRPAFEKSDLYEITGKRIDEWLEAKAQPTVDEKTGKIKPGLSWSTRTDIKNIFSSIFTCARAWKIYQEENPIEGVYVGRKRLLREKRKLTDDQTRKLLAAIPADVRLMCCVALFCTLRVSELLGLQERHLSFEEGTIKVEQRFYRGDLDIVKGQKSERTVPMGYLAADLKRICMGDPERFVFQIATRPQWGTQESACRDDRDILQHFIRPAAVSLGFYWKGFGWHSLRREAVTSLSAALGVNQAMTLAGHSTTDMSLMYTLADLEKQDEAIRARQEKILGKPQGGLQ